MIKDKYSSIAIIIYHTCTFQEAKVAEDKIRNLCEKEKINATNIINLIKVFKGSVLKVKFNLLIYNYRIWNLELKHILFVIKQLFLSSKGLCQSDLNILTIISYFIRVALQSQDVDLMKEINSVDILYTTVTLHNANSASAYGKLNIRFIFSISKLSSPS